MGMIKRPVNSSTANFYSANGYIAGSTQTIAGVASVPSLIAGNGFVSSFNGQTATTGLYIMQGARATQSDIDALTTNSTTIITALPRYSDTLVYFPSLISRWDATIVNKLTMNFQSGTALLSGTATWFMVLVNTSYAQKHVYTGDIGTDLTLATNNIIAGALYKPVIMSMLFPAKISW